MSKLLYCLSCSPPLCWSVICLKTWHDTSIDDSSVLKQSQVYSKSALWTICFKYQNLSFQASLFHLMILFPFLCYFCCGLSMLWPQSSTVQPDDQTHTHPNKKLISGVMQFQADTLFFINYLSLFCKFWYWSCVLITCPKCNQLQS